jgi:cathepsin A (carboxypeptidase C)
VPVYAAMTDRKFESIILVDPYVDPALHALSMYLHFCPEKTIGEGRMKKRDDGPPPRYLNETACAAMESAYGRCDKLRRVCVATYDADMCRLAQDGCEGVAKWVADEVRPGGRDPYDDRRTCREPPLCNDMGIYISLSHTHKGEDESEGADRIDAGQDRTDSYFNLPRVKQALGLPDDFNYESVNLRFNRVWDALPDVVVPSVRELTALLDDKHTRVLVINGNNDGAITTEGIVMAFDELPWHGHAAFRRLPYRPWHHLGMGRHVSGGQVKSYGNLTVVTVNEAGHMSVHDQPDATLQLLGSWLGRFR